MPSPSSIKASAGSQPDGFRFYLVLLVMVSIGAYLRLDQFLQQVLLDDEWHVIHQLLAKGPKELFLTYGHADFSIPLALLYWLESKLFGLSETAMRWPMMLAGLVSLLVFPLYVRKFFGNKVALFFSMLLAISPMLVLYSRLARPYALTLLLSLLALGAFHRCIEVERSWLKFGLAYTSCAIASAWLHLISLPLLVAPFLVLGVPALVKRDWQRVFRVFCLGAMTFTGLLALMLPPVLGHPEALTGKLGVHAPDLQTYYGVFFVWLGTPSLVVVLISGLLAALGAGLAWRGMPLITSLVAGLGLIVISILLTQPAWVHNPLTLARYLLPAIPLLLLAISLGLVRMHELLARHWGGKGKSGSWALTLSLLLLTVYFSPLFRVLANPNSNSLHSAFQFDFRDDKNLILRYQRDFPVSPFWQQLSSLPRDTLKIAASPFSFETHNWKAVLWEQASRQRVMPGNLMGVCVDHRWGEVPRGNGFRFQNVGYLGDPGDLVNRAFDLVVFQKPVRVKTYQGEVDLWTDTAMCEEVLRGILPETVYEDEWLLVFPLSEVVREQVNQLTMNRPFQGELSTDR